MRFAARGTRVLDRDEEELSDARLAAALRSRARRIHVYAAVAGIAYAAWAVLVWEPA